MTPEAALAERTAAVDRGALEARLMARFCPPLQPEDVRRSVVAAVALFETARVRTYLDVLIEREATARLRALLRVAMSGGAA